MRKVSVLVACLLQSLLPTFGKWACHLCKRIPSICRIRDIRGGGGDVEKLHLHADLTRRESADRFGVVSVLVVRDSDLIVTTSSNVTLSPLSLPESIGQGCLLVPEEVEKPALWMGQGLWKENSLPLWHSMALLSDIVVIMVYTTSSHSKIRHELVQALASGFRHRTFRTDLHKGRLLIVLPTSDDQELASWREQLVTDDMQQLTPNILQAFDIASIDRFRSALSDIIPHRFRGIHTVLPIPEAFPHLLQQVYYYLGGEEITPLLQDGQVTQNGQDHADVSPVTEPPDDIDIDDWVETDADIMEEAATIADPMLEQLDGLQMKQEQNFLDPKSLPMDFAREANPILTSLHLIIQGKSEGVRNAVIEQVGTKLRPLFLQHLQALRDHYGSLYEAMLDQRTDSQSGAASWNTTAEKMVQAFRTAAQQSIPELAREGGPFRAMDLDYVNTLAGLLSDMQDATELRQELADLTGDELEDEEVNGGQPKRRFTRWYHKLAARVLVLGVNYLQGWLAWQGIRRAALERERELPKFPLL